MPGIKLREMEPIDVALRKFKRICEEAGIQDELRKREFYEKPTWKRARLRKAAISRTKQEVRRTDVTRRQRFF